MMRRAGRVVTKAQGVAVIRAEGERIPEIGDTVIDERLRKVGRVVDIFGPVDRPYLAISPETGVGLDGLLSDVLYLR